MSPRLLPLLLALLVGLAPCIATAQDEPEAPAAVEVRAGRVDGNQVNLRAGPGTSYPHVARLDRDAPVLIVGADADWVRVRVPGGAPLFVFHTLVEHEEGALRARVTATNVLLRGTPSKAHLALHDQRLQPGDELLVLGSETDRDGGVWLRVLPPPRIHVWIHERYVRDDGSAASIQAEWDTLHRQRQDELTEGRTKAERDELAAERRSRFEAELAPLAKRADGGVVTEEHVRAARGLAGRAPDEASARRAQAVAEDLVRRMEEIRRIRDEAEARRRTAEQEARARAAAEEARRAREAEAELRRKAEERLRDRTASGRIVLRQGRAYLATAGGGSLRLTSKRFRLADFEGRRVELRGERVAAEAGEDRVVFVVEHLEVVRREPGPEPAR